MACVGEFEEVVRVREGVEHLSELSWSERKREGGKVKEMEMKRREAGCEGEWGISERDGERRKERKERESSPPTPIQTSACSLLSLDSVSSLLVVVEKGTKDQLPSRRSCRFVGVDGRC